MINKLRSRILPVPASLCAHLLRSSSSYSQHPASLQLKLAGNSQKCRRIHPVELQQNPRQTVSLLGQTVSTTDTCHDRKFLTQLQVMLLRLNLTLVFMSWNKSSASANLHVARAWKSLIAGKNISP